MRVEYQDLFSIPIPEAWEFYVDDEGCSLISPCKTSILYIHAETVQDSRNLPSLSRMLAGFLTAQHKPVSPEELLPLNLPQALCFAYQYGENDRVVRVWIVGHEKAWAFINFQTPWEYHTAYSSTIDQIINGFCLSPDQQPGAK